MRLAGADRAEVWSRSASARSSSTATGAPLGVIMLPGPGSVIDQRQEKREADGVDDASINEKDRDGDALQVDHGSEEHNFASTRLYPGIGIS